MPEYENTKSLLFRPDALYMDLEVKKWLNKLALHSAPPDQHGYHLKQVSADSVHPVTAHCIIIYMHDSQSAWWKLGVLNRQRLSSVGGSRGITKVRVQDHQSPVKLAASSPSPTFALYHLPHHCLSISASAII